jgi:hypothetical protein
MFNLILLTLLDQKEDYIKMKKELTHTPLEKSIDNVLELINKDIDKIIRLNQIKCTN